MQDILKSVYTSITVIVILLLFLFKGIVDTYAYTDGYEFLWNCTDPDYIKVFIQQGRTVSGWIITVLYPYIDRIADLSKVRMINLSCLFLSCVLIHKMLKQNNFHQLQSLAIIIVFICSPFSSIVVHWEATSSAIWGYPVALLSGHLVFSAYLNKELFSKKKFNMLTYTGIVLAIISLFIYQPSYTAFIFPAFLHFIGGQKRDVIWRFLLLHVFIYGIYFLLFKLQLNQLNIPPDSRAGIVIGPVKIYLFIKGVFLRSLHYNIIFASVIMRIAIITTSLTLLGYFIYTKTKNETRKSKSYFVLMLLMFYVLAYFPNFISADNFIAYRTLGTVLLLSSVLLISSITSLPLKFSQVVVILSAIIIAFIISAHYNNKTFTTVQSAEYRKVKTIIAEKLKQGYPKKILVIRAEEFFLVEQGLVNNVVTDEFGKLSNTVHWVPEPFVQHILYDLTGDKNKVRAIEITHYRRSELPNDSFVQQNDWVLDMEQIYLNTP
ncbi:MAG: hypothetical protein ACT4ON_00855 [Bacteroidota bacterium]